MDRYTELCWDCGDPLIERDAVLVRVYPDLPEHVKSSATKVCTFCAELRERQMAEGA